MENPELVEQRIADLLLVAEYMQIEVKVYKGNHRWVYLSTEDHEEPHYQPYDPDRDWNKLMNVCKKIIESYASERQDIFSALNNVDMQATFKACVEFIKFWNDPTRPKIIWTNHPHDHYPQGHPTR